MNYNKDTFWKNAVGWSSHQPLLFAALEYTGSGNVLELGIGSCSTPYLHDYCTDAKRMLHSYDNNADYFAQFAYLNGEFHKAQAIEDWDTVPLEATNWSVALVDHAPGERRVVDIARLAKCCQIMVIHDTEPAARHGYFYDNIWHLFSHVRHYEHFNCWATAVSNSVDLTLLNIPELPKLT